ncbi:MAG TPA: hypothetical protein VMH79_13245 [Thermoanaerobaculia bacterium]|nr:hypothetical protein [Thermoanaerobaculia bacterium]
MPTLDEIEAGRPKSVDLPRPTAWPMVMAFGIALLFAGLVTNYAVSAVGAALLLSGAVGWFREVLPHEREETVPVARLVEFPTTPRESVSRIDVEGGPHRARLPLEIHPVSAGVKGGLAGSVVMAALAVLYGVVRQGSVWYPINLLAAGASARIAALPLEGLRAFHADALLLGTAIHLLTSLLVGLLYGVMLPMFPRRPILLGGVIAPMLWTGLLHASLQIVNPTLEAHIDWPWFVVTQVGFGVAAGVVVTRSAYVRTLQFESFAVRAGIEAPGVKPPHDEEPR